MIRLATPDDASQIAAIYAPYVSERATSFELVPPDADEIRQRIKSVMAWYPWLAFVEDSTIQGYVYASSHHERAAYRWCANVAVYIRHGQNRRGIGRALYTSLFQILRAQGYVKLIAGVTLPNEASVGLHEAMGFEVVGVYPKVGYKLGQWLDVGWWQLTLQECENAPREPIGLAEVQKSAHWDKMLKSGERHLK